MIKLRKHKGRRVYRAIHINGDGVITTPKKNTNNIDNKVLTNMERYLVHKRLFKRNVVGKTKFIGKTHVTNNKANIGNKSPAGKKKINPHKSSVLTKVKKTRFKRGNI